MFFELFLADLLSRKDFNKKILFVLPVFLLCIVNPFVLEVAMDIILHSVTTWRRN